MRGESRGRLSPVAYTCLGAVAIALWSTTVAFSRRLTDALGIFTAASGVYLIAGVFAVGLLAARRGRLVDAMALPRRYLLVCGSLFVLYTALLYMSIGLAADSEQAVQVGIVNYLWPSCVILMSVPILGRRARWTVWPAVAMALIGVTLAQLPPAGLSGGRFLASIAGNPLPFVLVAVGAAAWGAYSNLSRRWTRPGQGDGAPLFLLASGIALLVIRGLVVEPMNWSAGSIAELVYTGLFPAMAGYLLYDAAIRKGHIVVVASMAYFIPLLSTLVSCLFLGVSMRHTFWLASALLIAAAALGNWSIYDRKSHETH